MGNKVFTAKVRSFLNTPCTSFVTAVRVVKQGKGLLVFLSYYCLSCAEYRFPAGFSAQTNRFWSMAVTSKWK